MKSAKPLKDTPPGYRNGGRQCKICNHPGRATIDGMLDRGGYTANEIIEWAQANFPDEEPLNPTNITRHKKHPLWRVIGVVLPKERNSTPDKDAMNKITPEVMREIKKFVPPVEERISLAEATAIVLHLALRNAVLRPELVTLKDAANFVEIARKLGLRGDEEDAFQKAWSAAAQKIQNGKVTATIKKELEFSPGDALSETVIIEAGADDEEWNNDE